MAGTDDEDVAALPQGNAHSEKRSGASGICVTFLP
jgi:hypothetical protein